MPQSTAKQDRADRKLAKYVSRRNLTIGITVLTVVILTVVGRHALRRAHLFRHGRAGSALRQGCPWSRCHAEFATNTCRRTVRAGPARNNPRSFRLSS